MFCSAELDQSQQFGNFVVLAKYNLYSVRLRFYLVQQGIEVPLFDASLMNESHIGF